MLQFGKVQGIFKYSDKRTSLSQNGVARRTEYIVRLNADGSSSLQTRIQSKNSNMAALSIGAAKFMLTPGSLTTIGGSANSDIVIDTESLRLATIHWIDKGGCFIFSSDKIHRTVLNQKTLSLHLRYPLSDGAILRLGQVEACFRFIQDGDFLLCDYDTQSMKTRFPNKFQYRADNVSKATDSTDRSRCPETEIPQCNPRNQMVVEKMSTVVPQSLRTTVQKSIQLAIDNLTKATDSTDRSQRPEPEITQCNSEPIVAETIPTVEEERSDDSRTTETVSAAESNDRAPTPLATNPAPTTQSNLSENRPEASSSTQTDNSPTVPAQEQTKKKEVTFLAPKPKLPSPPTPPLFEDDDSIYDMETQCEPRSSSSLINREEGNSSRVTDNVETSSSVQDDDDIYNMATQWEPRVTSNLKKIIPTSSPEPVGRRLLASSDVTENSSDTEDTQPYVVEPSSENNQPTSSFRVIKEQERNLLDEESQVFNSSELAQYSNFANLQSASVTASTSSNARDEEEESTFSESQSKRCPENIPQSDSRSSTPDSIQGTDDQFIDPNKFLRASQFSQIASFVEVGPASQWQPSQAVNVPEASVSNPKPGRSIQESDDEDSQPGENAAGKSSNDLNDSLLMDSMPLSLQMPSTQDFSRHLVHKAPIRPPLAPIPAPSVPVVDNSRKRKCPARAEDSAKKKERMDESRRGAVIPVIAGVRRSARAVNSNHRHNGSDCCP